MMSDFYTKDDLINVLKYHLLPEDVSSVNWDSVIDDGEIYPRDIDGITGCYIYQVNSLNGFITVFVHPSVCTEVYYDAWTGKEVYMGRESGEIW